MSDAPVAGTGGIFDVLQADDPWGVLSRDIDVRLLNVSGSGCLIESRCALEEGTTGSLRLHVDGQEYSDPVRITRCQAVQGAGATFRMGAEFLWVSVPDDRSLRRVGQKLHARTGSRVE